MHEWDAFDRALRDTATELPPAEETVRAVMPFRTAVRRVVTGLCLTFFTVNEKGELHEVVDREFAAAIEISAR